MENSEIFKTMKRQLVGHVDHQIVIGLKAGLQLSMETVIAVGNLHG